MQTFVTMKSFIRNDNRSERELTVHMHISSLGSDLGPTLHAFKLLAIVVLIL